MSDAFCFQRETDPSVGDVLRDVVSRPYDHLIRGWHWKSSLFSSVIRGAIFFAANYSAGPEAAYGAAFAEFAYRSIASGFYGSLTQALGPARPVWFANLAAAVLLPILQHTIELAIHWVRGTPNLKLSIGASVLFTVFSTLFNLYSMRRGCLVVGQGGQSVWRDVLSFPTMLWGFLASGAKESWRILWR